MKKKGIIIMMSVAVLISVFSYKNIAMASEKDNNTDEEYNIDDMSIDEIQDGIFEVSEILGADVKHDDSPLMQEIDLFASVLKKTVSRLDGTPDIGEHEPIWSYSLADNKIVDVVQVDNDVYAIWYNTNKTYRISGDALFGFIYDGIFKATGLEMQ